MNDGAQSAEAYRVPTYRAHPGTVFFHFLHGHVPRHQMDFIYRPEIPQAELSQQHFSHLARLVKYIEPQMHNPFAFAIGNLSRDDTQHEPGHGGLGLIFSMRVSGVTDHAGRKDPTFAHAAALIDKHLNEEALYEALTSFYSHLFGRSEDQSASALMYRKYVHLALSDEAAVVPLLRTYVREFDDLPKPGRSSMRMRWMANEAAQPKRVVIVHPNQIRFRHISRCASRIASTLYASNIRWTSVTNGREADVENGITVRLVSEADAGAYTSDGLVLGLVEVPSNEDEIAAKLFGAKPAHRTSQAAPALGWRARYEAERGVSVSGEEEAQEAVQMPDSGSRRDQRVMKEALKSSHAEVMEGREARETKEVKEEAVPSDRAERVGTISPGVAEQEKIEAKEAKAEKKAAIKRSWRALLLGLAVVLMGVAGAVIFWMGEREEGKALERPREKMPPVKSATVKPRETALEADAAPGVQRAPEADAAPAVETARPKSQTERAATGRKAVETKAKKASGDEAAPPFLEEAPAPKETQAAPKTTAKPTPTPTGVLGGELDL